MFKKLIDEIPVIEPCSGGYIAKYKNGREEFHQEQNPMLKWKSKEELDKERPQYALLPQEDYELVVVNVEPNTRKKYRSQENEEIVDVQLEVVCLKDGTEAIDDEGKEAKGRKVFFTLRPNSMGFMSDGTPSKSRTFIAFATKQDILGDIELETWEQLLGKTIFAEVVQYQNQKGQVRNKISRILPFKKK